MAAARERVLAIDVFRGITIWAMIFVNDLASVKNIPGWLKHFPEDGNGMTFVDVVFPAFLFIVGLSIPFAIDHRRELGDTFRQLGGHILQRTVSLIFIGVMMVNMGAYQPQFLHIGKPAWQLIFYLSVILFWNETFRLKHSVWKYLRYAAGMLLLLQFILYRGGSVEPFHWLHTSWWGILGLIGWAYLTVSVIYLCCGGTRHCLWPILMLLVLLYPGDANGRLAFLGRCNDVLWVGGHIGSHSMLSLAGLLTGFLFHRSHETITPLKRLKMMVFYAIIFFMAGYLLRIPFGVNKNMATPAWALYSAGWSVLVMALLYWILDVRKWYRWAAYFRPAGMNPLLAYLLPDILYAATGSFYFSIGNSGFGGILRSVIFTGIVIEITRQFTQRRMRLHL